MDLSIVAPGQLGTVPRIDCDEDGRRPPPDRPSPQEHAVAFALPPGREAFDSSAPVAVDAVTEAALFELQPVETVPLAEAIHRYVAED